MHDDLERLRDELAGVDRDLVSLVARRLALASAIGERKLALGRPTRDYAREREVLERARAAAVEEGMAPDLAEALLRFLIATSLTRQEQDRLAAAGGGSGKRALVIGGSGRMGGWFARFLASQGFAVAVADPVPPGEGVPWIADWRAGTLDEDVIVVAAPLQETAAILAELAPRGPAGLVFDVGSLKGPLRAGLDALRAAGVRVTSLHPMFGPDTDLLSGRHVIFVDCRVPEATAAARALFSPTMAVQVEMSADAHDRLIAWVLGLSHATNIAFAAALAASGESVPALEQMSSTTFDAQLAVAARVVEENPRLYFEIQALNAFGAESVRALGRAVEGILSAVGAGDEGAFVELMERGRAYLAGREARTAGREG